MRYPRCKPLLALRRSAQAGFHSAAKSGFARCSRCYRADRAALSRLWLPRYGYRRVTAQLAREGWTGQRTVNHKRVLRVLREESLLCRLQKRFVVQTTDSRHAHRCPPNLLKETTLTGPDQAWVADITYIRLPTDCQPVSAIWPPCSTRLLVAVSAGICLKTLTRDLPWPLCRGRSLRETRLLD